MLRELGILGVTVLSLGIAPACSSSNDATAQKECPVGSERCPCTTGRGCDPDLECRSGLCVDATSSSGAGGTGTPDAGGTGTSGAGGTGTPNAGGTGTSGAGGTGTPGAGGTPAVQLTACATSGECAADEVCAIKVDSTGYCLKGSGKPCEVGDFCAHSMGFDPYDGKIEGPACNTASDCNQEIELHQNTVCVTGDSGGGTCVALCQYRDDPTEMKCVTHPHLGLFEECTRSQGKIVSYLLGSVACVGFRIATWACKPAPRALTADEQWTVDCIGRTVAAGGAVCYPLNCFDGNSVGPPEAHLTFQQFLDLEDEMVDYSTVMIPGGGTGSGNQCGSDCECGHCGYCESGTCRYGGEGPYGCYRGCN